jgi:hypothetical protein
MKQATYYTYLGNTGTVTTSVEIPGVFSIKKILLAADEGKRVTKNNKNYFEVVMIPENELSQWYEVPYSGQN